MSQRPTVSDDTNERLNALSELLGMTVAAIIAMGVLGICERFNIDPVSLIGSETRRIHDGCVTSRIGSETRRVAITIGSATSQDCDSSQTGSETRRIDEPGPSIIEAPAPARPLADHQHQSSSLTDEDQARPPYDEILQLWNRVGPPTRTVLSINSMVRNQIRAAWGEVPDLDTWARAFDVLKSLHPNTFASADLKSLARVLTKPKGAEDGDRIIWRIEAGIYDSWNRTDRETERREPPPGSNHGTQAPGCDAQWMTARTMARPHSLGVRMNGSGPDVDVINRGEEIQWSGHVDEAIEWLRGL